jgi:hypothetical protein
MLGGLALAGRDKVTLVATPSFRGFGAWAEQLLAESTGKLGKGIVPVDDGQWTPASAAQARVIARMRERGYSVDAVKEAARGGRLAFGYAEDLFQVPEGRYTREKAAELTGLEPERIERLMTLLGDPDGRRREAERGGPEGHAPLRGRALLGVPPVAFLQLVRVYAQSIRRSRTPRSACSISTSTSP